MGVIYIANKDVADVDLFMHYYLIYDPDGNLNHPDFFGYDPENVDETILSVHPSSGVWDSFGYQQVELGTSAETSEDRFTDLVVNESFSDRNLTVLPVSSSLWVDMLDFATSLTSAVSGTIGTGIFKYDMLGPNSNSFIASILSKFNLNLEVVGPINGGDYSWDINPANDVWASDRMTSMNTGWNMLMSGHGGERGILA
jgi:hypothetical protein